ncbi:type II toxin-antitoxin system VapC family toxin, partial [Planococcus sp. SIMBA_160]
LLVDASTASRACHETLRLARAYRLSVYDAAYLELALRKELPLATRDERLAEAAARLGRKDTTPE